MVLAVVEDLLFASKIRSAAGKAGVDVVFARNSSEALTSCATSSPALVIVDLDRDRLDPVGTIGAIRHTAGGSRVRIVGFGSHVNVDRLQAARTAGCDDAMARSQFVASLPSLLAVLPGGATRPAAARPSLADVEAAAKRIGRSAWRTPLARSRWLSELSGGDVWLKLETVQRTGSFKFRGAYNALARLRETHPTVSVVVTASAGNHGLALATAAEMFGMRARVHLPATAPAAKRAALAALGAEIVEATDYDAAETAAAGDARDSVSAFVSAYSHSDVIAGAGTATLEMLDDEPSLDALVVPLGGGGLLSGAAIVARARRAGVLIVGAEAEASPVFTAALAAGRPVIVNVRETIADGLSGNMEPDSQTFGIVRDLVDRVVTVPEELIVQARRDLAIREQLIAEGAAATAVGALLAGGLPLAGRRIGLILSGRNVDLADGPTFGRRTS